MTTIATALNELGITEWVLRGEPTTEAEFNEMFRKVTGSDDQWLCNRSSSNPSDFGTTWSAVSAKKTELVNAELHEAIMLRSVTDAWLRQIGWLVQTLPCHQHGQPIVRH